MSDDTTTATDASGVVTVPPEVREQYPDLVDLVLASESMTNTERQYWIDILPVMTPDQVTQLRTILTNEKDQLAAIDAKYAPEIEKQAAVDLEGVEEERHRKRQELSSKEVADQTAAEKAAEDILSQMD
ncbi:hypothetical protein K8942_02800 [Candidatus Peribacteria bacterium]|nr:MAG: hypothetical protein K8942_02800 [Candidatus Peribacteria bacterium]